MGAPIGPTTGKQHLTIGFSRPMVEKAQLDKPLKAAPYKAEPAFNGEAKWLDERTLVVFPSKDLPVSTRYTITVPADTKSLDGKELGEDYTYAFNTERFEADLEVLGSDDRATPDQTLRVSFNQRVLLPDVLAHCALTGSKKISLKNGPQSPSGPAESYMLVPTEPLPADQPFTAVCEQALKGTIGNLGLAYDVKKPFHTFGPLKFVKFQQAAKPVVPDENTRLALVFTNPLKAPYKLTLSPPAAGFPQTCHTLDESDPGVVCTPALDAQVDYTLTVDASQEDTAGQKLGKTEVIKFHTVDARPGLSVESGYFIAELKRPVLPLWTRNLTKLSVTAVQITPENFHELRSVLQWWEVAPADLSKTHLQAKQIKLDVAATKNKWSQHPLGAEQLFGGTSGPGMFYVEIGSDELKYAPFQDGGRKKVLVNFTDIGVVSKLSPSRGLVWATKLSTGKPLPGATVTVRDGDGKVTFTGTTDADGVATLPGTDKLVPKAAPNKDLDTSGEHYEQERAAGGTDQLRIYVAQGNDFTMVSPTRANGLAAWNFNVSTESQDTPVQLRGFMHTDRGLYRPGDTVHVKGLARQTRLGQPLDVPGEGKPVKVVVSGPNGKHLLETTTKLSAFGGFWFDVELPGDARLGDYNVYASLDAGTFNRSFQVEEFRPASYEVTGKATTAAIVATGTIEGQINASYFYGAPVRGGEVAIDVHSRPRRVEFKGYDDYQFTDDRRYYGYHDESELSQQMVTEDHAVLDDKGNAQMKVAVGPNDLHGDADLLITASVTAPNNEIIAKSFTVPYFHSQKYVGIKMDDYFSDVGKPQKLALVALGADGKSTTLTAKVTVTRRDWNCVWEDWGYRGNYNCKELTVPVVEKSLSLSGTPTPFEFTAAENGEYIVAMSSPEAAASSRTVYAYGGEGGSWRSTDSITLEMVADKKEYKAGDTATILMRTDLAQATGLLTIERDGVIDRRMIELTPKTKQLKVPITAAMAPNVYVSVALVQGRMGDGERGKPRMRMGIIDLPVRPGDNKLSLTVDTDKKDYRPGEQVTATVHVVDAAGKPVAAEVSLTASDEGVLSLIGYETPNPIPTFYASWGLGVLTATQFEYIRDIPGANQERPATGGDSVGSVRSRFVANAVWMPNAVTDASGNASVTFSAPDNLTAFRVMALAADKGHRFGSTDKRFTVSKPVQLQSALPRFLAVGDVAQAGVVLHNDTTADGTATVTASVDGHVTLAGGLERSVPVGKGAAVPVWWQMTGKDVGKAKLTFTVTMGSEKDAVIYELPVENGAPIRIEPQAAGMTTAAMPLTVPMPKGAQPGAELMISVDPDGLSPMADGLRDLVQYPYGCVEQTTSKLIPMIAARELAEALAVDGVAGPDLEKFVKAGIIKIGKHQTTYGGMSLWPGGEPETYLTAYALWGLYLAQKAGYTVDAARIDDALTYLRNQDAGNKSRPHYYESGDLGSKAFALFVRAAMGDKSAQPLAATLLVDPHLPIYGRAFVARAVALGLGAKDPVVQKMVAQLANAAIAATKQGKLIDEPDEAYLWAYMSSSTRTTAAVLWALTELDPKNPAIRPLVDVLMAKRHTNPDWDTQSNAFLLLAISSYAKTLPAGTTSVAITANGQTVLSGALAGKNRVRTATVPMSDAVQLNVQPTGEVHYQLNVRYRKELAALTGESHGIKVVSEYLDENNKPKLAFKVGDIIRVRVTAEQSGDYDNQMLSVALPAGFEAINTAFKTTGADVPHDSADWNMFREMHDDRVDFASIYQARGKQVEEFAVRATQAGTFNVPPTRAELMYQPAVFAQTAASKVTIAPK